MNTPLFDDPHLAELADVLHFTPKDLDCNRQGDLTKTQYERLEKDLRKLIRTLTILLILSAGMGIIGLLDITKQPLLVWAALVIAALWAIVTRRGRLNRLKHGLDVERTLLQMPNNMMFHISESMHTPEGDKLFFPHRLYRTVYAGQSYTIYYVPMQTARRGFPIVSIEPVGGRVYAADDVKWKPKRKR